MDLQPHQKRLSCPSGCEPVPLPVITSRMLGCRRTVLRLGEDNATDLADLSRCSMLAWGLKLSSGFFFFMSM